MKCIENSIILLVVISPLGVTHTFTKLDYFSVYYNYCHGNCSDSTLVCEIMNLIAEGDGQLDSILQLKLLDVKERFMKTVLSFNSRL